VVTLLSGCYRLLAKVSSISYSNRLFLPLPAKPFFLGPFPTSKRKLKKEAKRQVALLHVHMPKLLHS
jgi:hypothetical protein